MPPDLYPYEQAKAGGVNFASRWGPGPGKQFKEASAGDFGRLATSGGLGFNLLGLGTYQYEFSTMRNTSLEKTWSTFKAFFGITPIAERPPLWPVKGKIWCNAPALMLEGDGIAWLVMVGRHGTLWEPLHLFTMWSDSKILFRRWCPDRHYEAAKALIAGEALAIGKATPWVHQRDLFS
ncbi:MAG: hypothetical protein J0I99_00490 [Devosia sp.]|uniref:hypothetical protein n=1 Tax=Devosia sp. TaxID=1871048 RepID=UPI001ACF2FCA|nr:hypothetical protein [Devosia sp.]MBN9310841.1 hypothetical protein [Devosia sp.]MBN9314194.1 hypothetical protein [Devosia sp.]